MTDRVRPPLAGSPMTGDEFVARCSAMAPLLAEHAAEGEELRRVPAATIEAVASGLIDVISSMHTPQDEESKRLPYEEAASGAVALETFLPAALRLYHAGDLTLPQLFRAMALNPARRLGLPQGRLAAGAPADLVIFDPDAPFVLDRFSLKSKSKNTPFDGARMQGKVRATLVAGRVVHQEGFDAGL